MNIYRAWNFIENPFSSNALQANETGKNLLVGRSREMKNLINKLNNGPCAVTVEGLNGVGKTSLVNVALYEAYTDYFDEFNQTLYIPCNKIFQLSREKSIESFMNEIFIEIAQTLIKRSEELKLYGYSLPKNSYSINKWLNSSHLSAYQASFVNVGIGKTIETNTSEGYEKSGFKNNIREWLTEIFPDPDYGGVVCVIDNLELLETSEQARRILESLRDELFNIDGVRWIFCGALGIIKSIASTPRLDGFLHHPIEVNGVDRKVIGELFEKRINFYKIPKKKTYLPLNSKLFEFIYEVINNNLRNSLHICDQYCLEVSQLKSKPRNDKMKEVVFMKWFQDQSNDIYTSFTSQIKPRARKLFDDIIKYGGVFSPSDYEDFGFNSITALRPHVIELERVAVLSSTVDEIDNRRKTIQVTAKGWLASYNSKYLN